MPVYLRLKSKKVDKVEKFLCVDAALDRLECLQRQGHIFDYKLYFPEEKVA